METTIAIKINFTPGAQQELKRIIQAPDFDQNLHLRIGVKGGGCSGLSYVLGFDHLQSDDMQLLADGIPYIMSKAHSIYLDGMHIDWETGLNNRGFTFTNPNASSTCGCGSSFAV